MSLVTPALAVVVGQVLSRMPLGRGWAVATALGVVLWQTGYGTLKTTRFLATCDRQRSALEVLAGAGDVVLDSREPGVVPVVLWRVPDDTWVLVDRQSRLTARQLTAAGRPELVYASNLRYSNSTAGRDRILRLLAAQGGEVTRREDEIAEQTDAFVIRLAADDTIRWPGWLEQEGGAPGHRPLAGCQRRAHTMVLRLDLRPQAAAAWSMPGACCTSRASMTSAARRAPPLGWVSGCQVAALLMDRGG